MEDTLAWVAELYDRNFVRMYDMGRALIFQYKYGAHEYSAVEDMIQDAFKKLIEKAEALKDHPNLDGWLVYCMQNTLMDYNKHMLVRYRHERFPKREEDWSDVADAGRTDRSEENLLDRLIVEDHLNQLEKLLGPKELKFFREYCIQRTPAGEIAMRYNMSVNMVYARANRLRMKILNNRDTFLLIVLLFFK